MVVKDDKNPENEGKVFLFRYGKKIFDKISSVMNPEYPDEKPMNPFDFWNGANFKIKIRNVAGYRNYDASEFDRSAPLKDDDAELEKIWNSQYSLKEFTDVKNFKSYDELKRRLTEVLGDAPAAPAPRAAEPTFSGPKSNKTIEDTPPWNEGEEEDLDYFKNMAKD
jgi:hypothetical protein